MKKILVFFLCLCILTQPVFASTEADALRQTAQGVVSISGTDKILKSETLFPAGTSASDWLAMAYALAGLNADFAAYSRRLEKYVRNAYKQDGGFGENNATRWHRIALTAAALGKDPTAFGADLIADGTYNFAGDWTAQGVNACIFALITLDSKPYTIPADSRYTREDLLQCILQAQNTDGGFGLGRDSSDADITAMAVQALSTHTDRQDAAQAVENALEYLAENMGAFGDFPSQSSETISQVIIALCAVGLDPQTAPRFAEGNVDLLQALEKYRLPDGSFAHTLQDSSGNLIATQQAMLAQIAVQKLRTDGTRLYDFSQIEPAEESVFQNPLLWAGIGVFFASFGASFYIMRRKKHHV